MRRGAKSKDFVHPSGLGDRLKSRNKALPCQWKFPRIQAGGRRWQAYQGSARLSFGTDAELAASSSIEVTASR
jgi:hypothetical protein